MQSPGLGSTLSKHVLGMKFMRKTLSQLESSGNSQITGSPSASGTNHLDNKSQFHHETIVEEIPSYSAVQGWNFARASFGGFNPTVEYHVRKGHWKAEHVPGVLGDPSEGSGNDNSEESDSESREPRRKRMKMDRNSEDSEGDGPVVGSIIGTAGGSSRNRKSKSKKPKEEDGEVRNSAEESEESAEEISLRFIQDVEKRRQGIRKRNRKQFLKDFDPTNSQNPNSAKTRRNQRRNQRRKQQKKTTASSSVSSASASTIGNGNASAFAFSSRKDKKMKFMKPEED